MVFSIDTYVLCMPYEKNKHNKTLAVDVITRSALLKRSVPARTAQTRRIQGLMRRYRLFLPPPMAASTNAVQNLFAANAQWAADVAKQEPDFFKISARGPQTPHVGLDLAKVVFLALIVIAV